MHEVSLIESVVAIVDEARRTQGFARLRTIRLQVGELSHAAPDALRFCFDAVTSGTIAEGAALMIEMTPGQGACPGCGQIVAIAERFAECPLCKSPDVRMVAGDAVRVTELEVE
jgi:hydrogenase nickel incorporation protein HypA/HybF